MLLSECFIKTIHSPLLEETLIVLPPLLPVKFCIIDASQADPLLWAKTTVLTGLVANATLFVPRWVFMVVLHPDANVVLKESFVHLKRLFGVILTDNGVEFKNPNALEHTRPGLIRTHVFFCDPQASWQTPQVENNHRLIRRIIPKGTSLNKLNVEDTRLVCCHINSVIRDNLDGKTPFDLMDSADEKKLLSALNLSPIPPDEVILSPKLIKH